MSVPIVVLAAGAATRMGTPKQALPWRGESLLRRAVRAAMDAAENTPVIVVTGAHAEVALAGLSGLSVVPVHNERWASGMASSIQAGLDTAERVAPACPAAVIATCDQPFVDQHLLRRLIATSTETGAPVVATRYADTVGVPALFARRLFPELRLLQGKIGAREIIQRHAASLVGIPFEPAAVDIDTPDDWHRLSRHS